jgi:hypothetical protein
MEHNGIDPSALPLITHRSRAVLTTDLLAQLCGCDPQQLRDNFRAHAGRFAEGKHYYRLEGAELRASKERVNAIKPRREGDIAVSLAPTVSTLLLWTERGAARHAKMLHTDQSWEIFEALEDRYFRREQTDIEELGRLVQQARRERDEARGYTTRMYREIQAMTGKLERIRDAYEHLAGGYIALMKASDAREVADILALYDQGKDFYEIGLIKGRSPNSVRHIVRRYRRTP